MAKGSKKYIGHEYANSKESNYFSKSALGKEMPKVKSEAAKSRQHNFASGGQVKKSLPEKVMKHGAYMADGGTAAPASTNPNPAIAAMGSAVANPQAAVGGSLMSRLFGKAKGGEMKKEDKSSGRKDIGDDNKAGSLYEMESSYKKGGKVKAESKDQKAEVKGNSLKNDKIPAMLSEGEDVLPRSVTKAKNAPEKAKKFVEKLEEEDKKKK